MRARLPTVKSTRLVPLVLVALTIVSCAAMTIRRPPSPVSTSSSVSDSASHDVDRVGSPRRRPRRSRPRPRRRPPPRPRPRPRRHRRPRRRRSRPVPNWCCAPTVSATRPSAPTPTASSPTSRRSSARRPSTPAGSIRCRSAPARAPSSVRCTWGDLTLAVQRLEQRHASVAATSSRTSTGRASLTDRSPPPG